MACLIIGGSMALLCVADVVIGARFDVGLGTRAEVVKGTRFFLLAPGTHVSRVSMLRMIAAFMILVLTMSHGSLGAAVPHGHGGSHDHAATFVVDAAADHHLSSSDRAAPADEDNSDIDVDGQPEASHVHLSVDALPRGAFAPAVFASPTDRFAPHASSALPSAAVPPLLEPPSA